MAAAASNIGEVRAEPISLVKWASRFFLRMPKWALIVLVTLYRWFLSPLKIAIFGASARCRYQPSCSAYAVEALRAHGFFYGSWLALRRLLRCHPWGECGPDPVPPVKR